MVIRSANEHGIDLSALLDGVAKPDTKDSPDVKDKVSDPKNNDNYNDKSVVEITEEKAEKKSSDDKQIQEKAEMEENKENKENKEMSSVVNIDEFASKTIKENPVDKKCVSNDYTEVEVTLQKRMVNRSIIIVGGFVLLVSAATIGILKPKNQKIEESQSRILELEAELAAMKEEQTTFKGLVPEDWNEKLVELKGQASQAAHAIGKTVESVKEISSDLTNEAGLNKRVEQLQTYVSEITSESGIFALKGRFDEMRNSVIGEKTLDSSVSALIPIFADSKNKDESQLNAMIDMARAKNSSLQQSLSNVPKNELKAAAMLLAMTQVRSALNRGDEQFYSDLELLKNMISEDDVELRAAIDKLAPYSKDGVLTATGLRKEFQSVAGESVIASLRGEDVSFGDKISAKFNEILKVEKDGELVTGTPTQATLNKAEKLIEKDKWPDAVNLLRSKLGARELEPLRPWIKEAEKMISSRKLDSLIEDAMAANFGTGLLGGEKSLKPAR